MSPYRNTMCFTVKTNLYIKNRSFLKRYSIRTNTTQDLTMARSSEQ